MIHVGRFTYHRWNDGKRTLSLREEGYPPFAPDLSERGWSCFFVGRHGSYTTWTYRRQGA